jgi:hypothetical protein
MNLPISLRSEMLKTRRTASLYLTLILAVVIPFIFFLDVCFDGVEAKNKKDIFNVFFREAFTMTGFLIFPIFIVLLCTLLPQIEYKNNAWKQVLASPQIKGDIFLAKFLNIHLLLLVFLVANHLFMFVAAAGIHFIQPSLQILDRPLDLSAIVTRGVNTYIALLALSALQFWLGLRFKNFIVPMAIGLSGWIIGALMVMEYKSSYAIYFPYSFHVFSIFPGDKPQLTSVLWTSVGYTVVLLVLSFMDFTRKRVSA